MLGETANGFYSAMRVIATLLLVLLSCSVGRVAVAGSAVQVLGLFSDAALLQVDGQQRLVKAGSSWRGVTLISADAKVAVVAVGGERRTVALSRHIASTFSAPPVSAVRLYANQHRQYITDVQIAGRRTKALVDTGANVVALSSATADRLGIDYQAGARVQVRTASGISPAHEIMLNEVSVGEIRIPHVRATVVAGTHPEFVLLGMTYLQHVEIHERDGVLELRRQH